MLNLYPRLSASSGSRDAYADSGVARPRAFFGIAVACVAILLFCCVLAATASFLKAGAFAATATLLLVFLGCFAPRTSWIRSQRTGRPASAVLALTARPSGGSACAPPAFAFVCPLEEDDNGVVDGEEAVPSCVVVCPVCLEGVHGGEMVRQLPACRHIFHVECIDCWTFNLVPETPRRRLSPPGQPYTEVVCEGAVAAPPSSPASEVTTEAILDGTARRPSATARCACEGSRRSYRASVAPPRAH